MAQTAQIFSSGNAQTIKAALKDFASTRLNLGPPTKPAAAQFFVRIKNYLVTRYVTGYNIHDR
jgi:hypothetical protein